MTPKVDTDKLTKEVKAIARQFGAVLVGVASIDRFDPQPPYADAVPYGHHPRAFVPDARAVISIAQPVLNAVMEAPAALVDEDVDMLPGDLEQAYWECLYNVGGHHNQDAMLESIGQVVGQHLQLQGFEAMVFPTPGMHFNPDPPLAVNEYQMWEGPNKEWRKANNPFGYALGPISHRHVATRAGLGEFGYNNVVLTKEFGTRQRFNSVVTSAELVPDPLITEPICLRDACNLCLKACPTGAITMRDDPHVQDYRSVQEVDRNRIFIDTPAKTDPPACRHRRERGAGSATRCFYGDCIRICPIPNQPGRLSKRLQKVQQG
jgi:ferredoxin